MITSNNFFQTIAKLLHYDVVKFDGNSAVFYSKSKNTSIFIYQCTNAKPFQCWAPSKITNLKEYAEWILDNAKTHPEMQYFLKDINDKSLHFLFKQKTNLNDMIDSLQIDDIIYKT